MLLGEILVSEFGVKEQDISNCLKLQQQVGGYLGQILIQRGLITEAQLVSALSKQLLIPIFDKDQYGWDHENIMPLLSSSLNVEFIISHNFIPVRFNKDTNTITMVTSDPLNSAVQDYLFKATDYDTEILLSTEQTIKELSRFYVAERGANVISLHVDDSLEKLKEMAFEAPVIRFLNNLISRAVELRATDIHIEPSGSLFRIRFRIDGILHEMETMEEAFYLAVVSRIKLLSNLDIAEKRLPQDGKFTTKIASILLDIRVSTIPMVTGESVVMRLLYRERLTFDIGLLGLEADHGKIVHKLIKQPYGMMLVTGPTGSGKTTTLYSVLTGLNDKERKIITIEDPVEYQIEGINQIQVKSEIGLSFASALRSILRHDPDVIMVGEIRDTETAEISIHSSLTGHLVLSTLHTNDSPSSLFRLIEMSIEDYLLNAAIIGVIAQRIIRKICPNCSETHPLSKEVMEEYDLESLHRTYSKLFDKPVVFMKGRGCQSCAGTGYRGRMAIFECFDYSDALKDVFIKTRSLEALRKALIEEQSFRTLRQDGMIKVMKGLTTIEEVLRVS